MKKKREIQVSILQKLIMRERVINTHADTVVVDVVVAGAITAIDAGGVLLTLQICEFAQQF